LELSSGVAPLMTHAAVATLELSYNQDNHIIFQPPSLWQRLWSLLQLLRMSPQANCTVVNSSDHQSSSVVPGPLLAALPLPYLMHALQFAHCLQQMGVAANTLQNKNMDVRFNLSIQFLISSYFYICVLSRPLLSRLRTTCSWTRRST
jgi:hypothetical protein